MRIDKNDPKQKREDDNLKAAVDKQAALIDYISAMSGIEIDEEDDSEQELSEV